MTAAEYRLRIEQAKQLLQGNYKSVAADIRKQMLTAAEELNFELAANLRDRLNAVEALGQKQLVTAGSMADTDVIGYGETAAKACFAVLHFSGGNLLDKEFQVFPLPDDKKEAISSLLKQFYLSRGVVPKRILLPMEIEDSQLFAQLMEQQYGRKPKVHVPQRGDNAQLVELASKNALEEATQVTDKEERISGTLTLLGKMLSMDPPKRLESFDISNISGTDIVASMVVFLDGKPHKSDYRHFKVEGLANQDDYASMNQVVYRRLLHLKAGDKGFDIAPDALLIDGGVNHARVALDAVQSLGLEIPVFGMVKDDRHRTRALVTPQGQEIRIDNNPSVFALIGNIQEQTHNFAISYHRKLRSKRLRYSALDEIPGIGQKRKQLLLKQFKSISAIRSATMDQLLQILPSDAAMSVYKHFHNEG
jgi:excinuclease ABC subunit C